MSGRPRLARFLDGVRVRAVDAPGSARIGVRAVAPTAPPATGRFVRESPRFRRQAA